MKPFVDCILNNLDLGVSITIDVTGFSKWTPGAKKMVGGNDNPAYVAFMQAVGAVRKYAFRDDDRISVMCDHDEDTALNFYALYRRFKAIDPEFRKKLVSISFSNDEQFPGLQAADLIAGLMRLEALRSFGYHTHDFRALTSSLMEPRENQKLKWIGMIGNSEKVEEMGEFLERRARAV